MIIAYYTESRSVDVRKYSGTMVIDIGTLLLVVPIMKSVYGSLSIQVKLIFSLYSPVAPGLCPGHGFFILEYAGVFHYERSGNRPSVC